MASDLVGVGRLGVAEDVGVAGHQLVVDPPGHVGQGEASFLGRQAGVEVHLEQQVAQLLFEVGDRLGLGLGAGATSPGQGGRPPPSAAA